MFDCATFKGATERCYPVNERVTGIVDQTCNNANMENDVIVLLRPDIVIKRFKNRHNVKDKVGNLRQNERDDNDVDDLCHVQELFGSLGMSALYVRKFPYFVNFRAMEKYQRHKRDPNDGDRYKPVICRNQDEIRASREVRHDDGVRQVDDGQNDESYNRPDDHGSRCMFVHINKRIGDQNIPLVGQINNVQRGAQARGVNHDKNYDA